MIHILNDIMRINKLLVKSSFGDDLLMKNYRIDKHPVITIPETREFTFFWNNEQFTARAGETIASALISNGVRIFGRHPKDHSPQGIFCANGQCSQCMVIADDLPVKSCMEMVFPDMKVRSLESLPVLPRVDHISELASIKEITVSVLIIGGGPAGLSAAIELGKMNVRTLLIDDKNQLGGKLVLQTHRFFGSTQAVYAGTRGIDIAKKLSEEIANYPTLEVWLQSTALAVFSDGKVGVWRGNGEYVLIKPQTLLVASGARENFLSFPGNTLPGVFGAGAFQTLVNRDLVRPSERLFIVGGGNVGLIAGYHAIQARIQVVGLVEALPECGGYKVHRDKLARIGVPIYTSHTILSANGKDQVESITISKVDSNFQPIKGTEKSFACDSILIAVGLNPVDEFFKKAVEFGMKAYAAGDAEEIAEASAAMFSGKIKGHEIGRDLRYESNEIPTDWYRTSEILKSKPGLTISERFPNQKKGVIPILHCTQEIPCDPCSALCNQKLIKIAETDIRALPEFFGSEESCKGCLKCVIGCPGLAITLVDYRQNPEFPLVSIPFEFGGSEISQGQKVIVLETSGEPLGEFLVSKILGSPKTNHTYIVQLHAPDTIAAKIAGVQIQDFSSLKPLDTYISHVEDDAIICRCERVTAREIREIIRNGHRDINEIKTMTRAGMGACGSKTCNLLILRLFREEGIPLNEITSQTVRPLFVEVSLGIFAGVGNQENDG
jgi:sarcosine oxidase subunit alpha